jgi:hypothetical protein
VDSVSVSALHWVLSYEEEARRAEMRKEAVAEKE